MKIRGKNSSAANAGRTACLLLAACCWLTAITGTAGAIGGDLNSDGLVDWSDVASLAGGWPQIYVLTDYAHLAVNWLRTDPIANQTACYRLDETGGVTAFDSSGNNRNGTLKVEAGELIENGFAWQPAGVHGGAIMFDGDGVSGENPRPYIEIPTAGMSAAAGMVALWANLADPAPANDDSRNNNIYLFGLYGDTADKVKLYVTGSATLKFNIGNCSFSGTNGFAFTRGQWTHIAILWDNGIYVIYINGSPEPIYSGDGTYTAPSFDTLPATADIGNTGETNKAFSMHGMIDEVRIFNRPMNTAQIRWISDGAVRAWDPSPPDAATDIPVEGIALQWTPARETDTYNIYFGTANSPPFAVNLPITHYQLPPLSPATVYYWRVDGVGAADTVTGNLWSFRTVPLPDEPSSPSPANGAANVDIAADLSWKNGAYTTSSAVYFGTFNPPPFAANLPITNYQLPVASYQLPILSYSTVYYWRIDQTGPGGKTTGSLYSFISASAQAPVAAEEPFPANGKNKRWINIKLKWNRGFCATSHDVYFGSTSSPPFAGNQTQSTFDPGNLTKWTTYYWRIDEKNSAGTTTGSLWSFTTAKLPLPSTPPGYIIGWKRPGFDDSYGVISDIPDGNDYVLVTPSAFHSLALRSDGTIVEWGDSYNGPTEDNFVAMASGNPLNFAIRTDGTVVQWNGTGKTPDGNDFTAVSYGGKHNIFLREDGTLLGWGYDSLNQVSDTPTDCCYIDVGSGNYQSIALKSDRTVACWGNDSFGLNRPPAYIQGRVTDVSAGGYHNTALLDDGTIACWGNSDWAPPGNDFVAVSDGGYSHMAMRADSSIVLWHGSEDVIRPETPVEGGYVSIAAGNYFWLAIKAPK